MLDTESGWRRARIIGRIWMAVAIFVLATQGWLTGAIPVPEFFLNSFAFGTLGFGLLSEFWLYRKPKERPSDEVINRIDRQNIPVMLISTISTWTMLGAFVIASQIAMPDWLFWTVTFIGALSLLVALCLLPRLINHMRLARVAPELYHERSQHNLAKAYRQAFTLMFQVSFLGGLALMWDVIVLPAGVAVIGVGLVGIMSLSLLWCWYDWKDSQKTPEVGQTWQN
ncbi:MAG: hypothetical protein MJH10_17290 [Epibacterium sp.]|nr:hypothetical protein [Epibacterium sp.]NQX75264.1 hypothetical protein [Epibacterium sp.]